jgi:hypothetical protein
MDEARDERLLRAALAPARGLEPSAAEVARVVARSQGAGPASRLRPLAGWQRLVAPGLAALVLLIAGLYIVPVTRGAIDDVVGTVAEAFSGYSRGDEDDAPGRVLAPGEVRPAYFDDLFRGRPQARDQRVLAEAGGYKLFAYRAPSGSLSFDLGNTGVGMGFESAAELEPAGALYLLGPGSMQFEDEQGHIPLFGLAADSVRSVALRYETGPPLRIDDVVGGFVLLIEPDRGPMEVVAFDAAGTEVEQESVDYPDGKPGNSWERYVRPGARERRNEGDSAD